MDHPTYTLEHISAEIKNQRVVLTPSSALFRVAIMKNMVANVQKNLM